MVGIVLSALKATCQFVPDTAVKEDQAFISLGRGHLTYRTGLKTSTGIKQDRKNTKAKQKQKQKGKDANPPGVCGRRESSKGFQEPLTARPKAKLPWGRAVQSSAAQSPCKSHVTTNVTFSCYSGTFSTAQFHSSQEANQNRDTSSSIFSDWAFFQFSVFQYFVL